MALLVLYQFAPLLAPGVASRSHPWRSAWAQVTRTGGWATKTGGTARSAARLGGRFGGASAAEGGERAVSVDIHPPSPSPPYLSKPPPSDGRTDPLSPSLPPSETTRSDEEGEVLNMDGHDGHATAVAADAVPAAKTSTSSRDRWRRAVVRGRPSSGAGGNVAGRGSSSGDRRFDELTSQLTELEDTVAAADRAGDRLQAVREAERERIEREDAAVTAGRRRGDEERRQVRRHRAGEDAANGSVAVDAATTMNLTAGAEEGEEEDDGEGAVFQSNVELLVASLRRVVAASSGGGKKSGGRGKRTEDGGLDGITARRLRQVIQRLSHGERCAVTRVVTPPTAALALVKLLAPDEMAKILADRSVSPRRTAQILRVSPRDTGSETLKALATRAPGKAGQALRFIPESAGFVNVALGRVSEGDGVSEPGEDRGARGVQKNDAAVGRRGVGGGASTEVGHALDGSLPGAFITAPPPAWLTLASLPLALQVAVLKAVPASAGWRLVSVRAAAEGAAPVDASIAAGSDSRGDGSSSGSGGGDDGDDTSRLSDEFEPPDVVAKTLNRLVQSGSVAQAASIVSGAPATVGAALLVASDDAAAQAMLAEMPPGEKTEVLRMRYESGTVYARLQDSQRRVRDELKAEEEEAAMAAARAEAAATKTRLHVEAEAERRERERERAREARRKRGSGGRGEDRAGEDEEAKWIAELGKRETREAEEEELREKGRRAIDVDTFGKLLRFAEGAKQRTAGGAGRRLRGAAPPYISSRSQHA